MARECIELTDAGTRRNKPVNYKCKSDSFMHSLGQSPVAASLQSIEALDSLTYFFDSD